MCNHQLVMNPKVLQSDYPHGSFVCSVCGQEFNAVYPPEEIEEVSAYDAWLPAYSRPWTLLASATLNNAVGKDMHLLHRLPEDMKFFREKTLGKTVIYGRKTLESLPGGRPLKDRFNIVLSRAMPSDNLPVELKDIVVVHNVSELMYATANIQGEIYVIGGAEIYSLLLPYCGEALITRIRLNTDGDAFLPPFTEDPRWQLQSDDPWLTSEAGVQYRMESYVFTHPEYDDD